MTSTLSAVVGLAGGIGLLAALLVFLDPLVAIPLHGVVQLVSNASRAYLQRAHVHRPAVARFVWLLLPAGALGLALAQRIPPDAGRLAIGLFVLLAVWLPRLLPGSLTARTTPRSFILAGALVGFANMIVGATGPLIAPFVLGLRVSRHGVVGTLAACQTLGHAAKIALFAGFGFAFRDYAVALAAMAGAAIAGSWLGTRLLARVSERGFRLAIRSVLTALGLYLVIRSLA